MRRFLSFLWLINLLLITFLTQKRLHAQGPISGFMNNKGTTDIALTYSTENYQTYLFGKEKQSLANKSTAISLFIEHNFTDSLSIVASIPYIRNDETNKGLQDGNLFIKYRNVKQESSKHRFSMFTAVGLSFPLSQYPNNSDNPIGEQSTSFLGRLALQYDVHAIGTFFHIQSGLNFRVIPTAQSGIPFLFRAGFGTKSVYLDGWIEFQKTFTSGIDDQIFAGAGSDWLKIGGTIYYGINSSLGFVISGSKILSGRNIGLANRLNLGMVYRIY